MSKPHLTTNRDRLSKKYRDLHTRLKAELKPPPDLSKQDRKRAASQAFRATGGQ